MGHYLVNIEDQSRSLSNIELKNFIAKFAEMLKKDHDLSKYWLMLIYLINLS